MLIGWLSRSVHDTVARAAGESWYDECRAQWHCAWVMKMRMATWNGVLVATLLKKAPAVPSDLRLGRC